MFFSDDFADLYDSIVTTSPLPTRRVKKDAAWLAASVMWPAVTRHACHNWRDPRKAAVEFLAGRGHALGDVPSSLLPWQLAAGVLAACTALHALDPVLVAAAKAAAVANDAAAAVASYLEAHGKVVHPAEGDGACLFRCWAYQLFGSQEQHGTVRQACCDYMLAHRGRFENFVHGSFDAYLAQMRQPHEWGDEPEIRALGELYNKRVRVYQHHPPEIDYNPGDSNRFACVQLRYRDGNHYDSVWDAQAPFVPLGDGSADPARLVDERERLWQAANGAGQGRPPAAAAAFPRAAAPPVVGASGDVTSVSSIVNQLTELFQVLCVPWELHSVVFRVLLFFFFAVGLTLGVTLHCVRFLVCLLPAR